MDKLTAIPAVATAISTNDGKRFLLVLRGREPNKDLWAFPGGKVDENELLAHAATRELMEETGIVVDANDLSFVTQHITDTSPAFALNIFTGTSDSTPIAADDAADAGWFTPEQIATMPRTPRIMEVIKAIQSRKSERV